ncbi:phage neck terminator protein [Lacticaseibacillus saniviri]
MYDYEKLYVVFSKIAANMGLTLIEMNGGGKQPKPPFVAFDIINPHIRLNFLEDDGNRAFECVVSFTVYAVDKLHALNLTNQLREKLNEVDSWDFYDKNHIVLVERMDPNVRYLPEAGNYATMVGFDARLRLQADEKEVPYQIDHIDLNLKGE